MSPLWSLKDHPFRTNPICPHPRMEDNKIVKMIFILWKFTMKLYTSKTMHYKKINFYKKIFISFSVNDCWESLVNYCVIFCLSVLCNQHQWGLKASMLVPFVIGYGEWRMICWSFFCFFTLFYGFIYKYLSIHWASMRKGAGRACAPLKILKKKNFYTIFYWKSLFL